MYDRVITNTLKELSGEVEKESRKNQTKRRAARDPASVLRSEHVLARDDCAIFSAILSSASTGVSGWARLLNHPSVYACVEQLIEMKFRSTNGQTTQYPERAGNKLSGQSRLMFVNALSQLRTHKWNIFFYVFCLSMFFPDRHETERLIKLERRNRLKA